MRILIALLATCVAFGQQSNTAARNPNYFRSCTATVTTNCNPRLDSSGALELPGTVAIGTTAPTFDLFDSTAAAKWLRVRVDADKAHLYEGGAGAAGDILSLDLTNKRVGIGTASPSSKLLVVSDGLIDGVYVQSQGTAKQATFGLRNSSGTIKTFYGVAEALSDFVIGSAIGDTVFRTENHSLFFSVDAGVSALMTLKSAAVGIGTVSPIYLLDVAKSGASGTARFYDQTATTGSTLVTITPGAAQTAASTVLALGGQQTIAPTLTGFSQGGTVPVWQKITKTYADSAFLAAASAVSITLATLPASTVVHGIRLKHSTAFAGTGITSMTCSVGDGTTHDLFLAAVDVFAAVGNTALGIDGGASQPTIATQALTVRCTANTNVGDGDATTVLTAGSLTVHVLTSTLVE